GRTPRHAGGGAGRAAERDPPRASSHGRLRPLRGRCGTRRRLAAWGVPRDVRHEPRGRPRPDPGGEPRRRPTPGLRGDDGRVDRHRDRPARYPRAACGRGHQPEAGVAQDPDRPGRGGPPTCPNAADHRRRGPLQPGRPAPHDHPPADKARGRRVISVTSPVLRGWREVGDDLMALRHTPPPPGGPRARRDVPRRLSNGVTLMTLVTQRVLIGRRGKELAALIPIADLRLLERLADDLEDRLDAEDALRVEADASDPSLPWELKGELPLRKRRSE